MAEIQIHARAAAPLETVWEVLYDQAGMSAWTLASSVRLEREGDPPPNGVGAIRVFSRPPIRIREEITAVESPIRLAYRLLSGLPARDYVGETILTSDGDATDIVWTITLTPRLPGLTFVTRRVINSLAKGLAAEAGRRGSTGGHGLPD